jgi:hypothetical protein
VKAQNPGVDLVMNVNWDKVVVTSEPLEDGLPPLAGFSGFGVPEDESLASEGKTEPPGEAKQILTEAETSVAVESVTDSATETEAAAKTEAALDNENGGTEDDVFATAVGPNVMMVILFLVVATVIATMFFRPKV